MCSIENKFSDMLITIDSYFTIINNIHMPRPSFLIETLSHPNVLWIAPKMPTVVQRLTNILDRLLKL